MKLKFHLSQLAIFLLFIPSISAGKEIKLYLAPGEQRSIDLDKVSSIAIGNRNIVEVKFSGNKSKMILIGKNIGLSNIIVWGMKKTNYSVSVISSELKGLYNDLKRSLSGIHGTDVKILGNKVALDGVIYRTIDKNRIDTIKGSDPRILDLTRPAQSALDTGAKIIKERLREKGFPGIKVRPAGTKIHLSGQINESQEKEQILDIAGSVFPFLSHSFTESFRQKMIFIDLKIVEISRNIQRILGINWQDSAGIRTNLSISSKGGTVGTLSLGEGFETVINMLSAKGYVRILSNPRLLCRNGKPTNFQSGGEIPIRLIGERNSDILFKNYGLLIEVTALAGKENDLSINIKAQISDVNFDTKVEGIPGFVKNSLETSVNLPSGDTVILAGLLENKSGKTVEKLPLLGHIPFIGELFKSRAYRNNRTEFSIFLTPIITKPRSKIHRTESRSTRKGIEHLEKKLKYSLFD